MSQNAYTDTGYDFHEHWLLNEDNTFVLRIRGEGPMNPMSSRLEGTFQFADKAFTFPGTQHAADRRYLLVDVAEDRMTVVAGPGRELRFHRVPADAPPKWPHIGSRKPPPQRLYP
ncbi:hypothetical protein [Kiloniella litopenaei]|uniref:hypothetical protein n=1 Tax=Kiloniella litopenaei TaxID=1549748 RepID=UPI003BAAA51E